MYRKFGGAWFNFKVHNETVTVMFGKEARKQFFSEKSLSNHDGYALLFPLAKYMPASKPGKHQTNEFSLHLQLLKRTDFLEPCLSPISHEGAAEFTALGDRGIFSPFVTIEQLMLRISLRVHLGPETTSDATILYKAMRAYRWIRAGDTPSSLLFPLFPTPSRIRRIIGAAQLYQIVSRAYAQRRDAKYPRTDILQSLIDADYNTEAAVSLMIMTVFVDHTNTGPALCWFLTFLCHHETWKAKAQAEIDAFVLSHGVHGVPLSEVLASLPFATWEKSLPTIDLCLQESLRLVANAAIIRRNMGDNIDIAGNVISRGDYAMYMTADTHLNDTIFPEPDVFNPNRDFGKPSDGFLLAWGTGSHPCLGQRLGKVTVKLITTLLLSAHRIEVIDSNGQLLKEVPKPQLSLFTIGRPEKNVFFRYEKRQDVPWCL
ncbi:cytochrome P450 [Mycena belliarum]|uniref:Cytochrome P450 n=1 Tax=Mycena belliarum TaxID=1033014 RepID=A0AAD6U6L4_9AGAR|nr:cytochrome P450 [Mycena belliae]